MLSNSTNPWLQVGKSGVQLIHTLTPGYTDTPVENIALWVLYNRKTRARLTRYPVTLGEIPGILRGAEATYGPAQYNAYPRGSLRRNRHYYCRLAYGQLEVYTLHDDQLAYVYSLNGDLLWLDVDDLAHRKHASYLRHQYFQHDHGELTPNLYQVDRSSRDRVARRWHDDEH